MIILTAVLTLTGAAPFAVYYAVRLAKRGDFDAHQKIQNITFLVCVLGVLALEGLIRFSGGSGSLSENSSYAGTSILKTVLTAHIIGAILTYLLWTFQIMVSNLQFRKNLPGRFSSAHRMLGYVVFCGLVYTAITAAIVYAMLWL